MGDAGEQIVFHSGEQRLAHELERIGLDSLIWVRTDLSEVSTVWMYFDNDAAEQLSSGAETFSEFEVAILDIGVFGLRVSKQTACS